jgi:hypothetical protein
MRFVSGRFPSKGSCEFRRHVCGCLAAILSLQVARRTGFTLDVYMFVRTLCAMSITPQELQKLLDELQASRASRRRAWENLQEIRWVLKDSAGMDLPPPARKTIDLQGRLAKDGVRKAIRERQLALADLVHAIKEYRRLAESKPLTLQGSDYVHAVQELNKAIDRAEGSTQV